MGAGPAGSSVAALLAQRGCRVLVLDKQKFPRFQIGESLLPACLPVLEQLGVAPVPETHLRKAGAEFVRESTGERHRFDFSEAMPGPPRHAWQVARPGFDTQIRDAARSAGATVMHDVKVVGVDLGQDEVRVRSRDQTFRGRYVLDATGQNRLMARRTASVEPYPGFGLAAAYTHFDGLSDAACAEIEDNNDVFIMVLPEAWGWIIPLPDRRLSVGIVTRRKGVTEDLEAYVAGSPLIQRLTQGCRRIVGNVVRNFSYNNTARSGARYGCVGDAGAFLDPVFSSGVALALTSAERTARELAPALLAGREADPDLLKPVALHMQRAYDTFSAIIDRFYHTNFVDNFIFGSLREEEMTRGVTSVLAGDVWRSDNRFQEMLLRSWHKTGPKNRRHHAATGASGQAFEVPA